ncbi:helix-turn-helix domain-containing protein [Polaribacter vadi]|uniref:helix-turn-helix domain-containing protein n=1 Tax=Polaribacter TaxID=52959 RepID=UPI001C09A1DA|nr:MULTISPECIES: helix-turn-helix domain-containing protein [Polaribacter]MBU3011408.1 helix-turn-helix domain-containing protein [Polaribacter vadi]MDO6741220.1 helix-turn-helix domain-containing protein [Polaribacter sp. 1_MG-2023]
MSTSTLQNNYNLNFSISNFNILKIEDLLESEIIETITKNHKVSTFSLLFITENIGRHSIGYKDYYFTKGTILAIRKDKTHHFYNNKNVRGYFLLFKEDFLNSYLNQREISKTIQMFNEVLSSPKTQLKEEQFNEVLCFFVQIEKEFTEKSDEYSLKIIRSLLHILITIIHRIKSMGYNKVQLSNYLKEFIKFQNLLESDYNKSKKVNYYANKLGFSTKKLNTIVQYIADKPVKAFIDDLVIIKAKSFLLHSNLSVKEVAFKLGFKDPTNLYKYFRKHTQFTPEAFRKRYRE